MNKIRELRLSLNLTQSDLAEKLGINQSAVGKYERGELEPSISTLRLLSKIFECSIDYIVCNSDDFGVISISNDGAQLSSEEAQLLHDFRALSPDLKNMLLATVATWKGTTANKDSSNRRA